MIFTIRTRLAASIVVVVLTMGVVSTIVGVRLFGDTLLNEVQQRVDADLGTAFLLYGDRLAKTATRLQFIAADPDLARGLSVRDKDDLSGVLARAMSKWELDVLTAVDADGRVVARGGNPAAAGDVRASDPIVARALESAGPVSGTIVLSAEALALESPDAARRAVVPVAEPEREAGRARVDEGMMLAACVPVVDRGKSVGALYGGVLLNGREDAVDEIAGASYGRETWEGRTVGSATVFLDGVSIATSVRDREGDRAVGARASGGIDERVLGAGAQWTGRAFVADDWYIGAYGPIRGLDGGVIGMLSVGVLADRFDAIRRQTILTFAAVSIAGMVLALFIASYLTGGLLRPVRHLAAASREIAKGNVRTRVEVDSKAAAELVELGEAFNIMAASIAERDEKLLENARKMSESKKLATLGQLAAGIAHEINNPLGGILLYSHMLREDLLKPENRENVQKIAREAERCKRIVKGLLDFARQTKPERSEADLNHVLDEVIGLLEHQVIFHGITVARNYSTSIPLVNVDSAQMQEVFMNIILNAAQAMDGKGTLTATTRLIQNNRAIEVEIRDTGPGIPADHLDKIFEPFFTTKEVGRGTGLGLSIAYGIVDRHHGSIRVESEVGKGTAFFVRIPVQEAPPPM